MDRHMLQVASCELVVIAFCFSIVNLQLSIVNPKAVHRYNGAQS
jgi:hypothetical protein